VRTREISVHLAKQILAFVFHNSSRIRAEDVCTVCTRLLDEEDEKLRGIFEFWASREFMGPRSARSRVETAEQF
jgi:hypothetical protein